MKYKREIFVSRCVVTEFCRFTLRLPCDTRIPCRIKCEGKQTEGSGQNKITRGERATRDWEEGTDQDKERRKSEMGQGE